MPDNAATAWLTPSQLAKYLSVSVRQVQILTKAGKLPVSYQFGQRCPRYRKEAVDAWMMTGESIGENQSPLRAVG